MVLFSGQDAFSSLIKQGPTLALSTLAFLLLFKGAAWSISLGNFRGGPTFPGLFIGAAGGLLAAHLPGFSETPAVAVLMAAITVSILRLPLSATVIVLLLTSKAGIATAPLIIVAVVVAYLTIQTLTPARAAAAASAAEPRPPHLRTPPQPQTQATVRPDQRIMTAASAWCAVPHPARQPSAGRRDPAQRRAMTRCATVTSVQCDRRESRTGCPAHAEGRTVAAV